jgi:transposase
VLQPHVAELVVCDPRKNRLTESGNKSDCVDAARLAELLRLGSLKPVYHGESGTRQLKELVRAYERLVSDSVRNMNYIKAAFRSRGILAPGAEVFEPSVREAWLKRLPLDGLQRRAGWALEQLDLSMQLRHEAEKAMLQEARKHRPWKLLRTVPGIGPIRAAEILGVVGSPHRFRTKRQFWCYVGLAVVTRSSADYRVDAGELKRKLRQSTRGLNRNHNPQLKAIFKGAVLDSMRGDFREHFEALVKGGMRPEMARLTVARKLAAITLSIWKTGEPYDPKIALKN